MSENESGVKRSNTDSDAALSESKKIKLNNDEASLPILSYNNTLVLNKAQEDTINQLMESANISSVNVDKAGPQLTKESNNTEQEMLSADIEKPVTEALSEQEKQAEDLNITSEQLLFALTSSVAPTEIEETMKPTSGTTDHAKAKESHSTVRHMEIGERTAAIDKSIIINDFTTTAPSVNTTQTVAQPLPPSAPTRTASLPAEIKLPTANTGLGITSNSNPTVQPNTTILTTTATNNTSSTSNTIPAQFKANTNTNMSGPSLTGPLTNLPDISAALRRLSSHTVPASVIEQLSSSPRLPNIGHLQNGERRTSDVSPSEILGNALAAVAANAAAASRSSPKLQPTSNAATAIGNLAAITANISNLLHSGGFHRNSFSQEDTEKLAAAIRQQPQQQQRRKSSMATFSNMIDQAMHRIKKPKLIVKNEQVWKLLEGQQEKHLGCQVYTPQLKLPNLEHCLNGVMEIRVPARYLTFENTGVKKRAVWGTDIYTDDSDIVAMIIHSGQYVPKFIEPEFESGDPFILALTGKQKESLEAAKKLALSGKHWIRHDDHLMPDHDLKVVVRVLPPLQSYTGSLRHRLKSRDWKKHDGMSLFVTEVDKIKKGEARLRGRNSIKSNMFAHEHYRKQALGLTLSQQKKLINEESKPIHAQKGRVKNSPRVLRMFQIRSEDSSNKEDSEKKEY